MHCLKKSYAGILTVAALIATLMAGAVSAAEPAMDARAQDRAAINHLIIKYAQAYDALDADAYVSVFADDAVFTFSGKTLRGKAQIRTVVTDAQARRAGAAADKPVMKSFHSITNSLVDFTSGSEAHHRAYWQIVSGPAGGPMNIGNMGIYEDVLVKRNGQWLIQTRNIPQ